MSARRGRGLRPSPPSEEARECPLCTDLSSWLRPRDTRLGKEVITICQKTRISFKHNTCKRRTLKVICLKGDDLFWVYGQAFTVKRLAKPIAKHLTNPAGRSGSGQESRQPSQRCEQSMNKYNETRKFESTAVRVPCTLYGSTVRDSPAGAARAGECAEAPAGDLRYDSYSSEDQSSSLLPACGAPPGGGAALFLI